VGAAELLRTVSPSSSRDAEVQPSRGRWQEPPEVLSNEVSDGRRIGTCLHFDHWNVELTSRTHHVGSEQPVTFDPVALGTFWITHRLEGCLGPRHVLELMLTELLGRHDHDQLSDGPGDRQDQLRCGR
jgi:hypothetical protein